MYLLYQLGIIVGLSAIINGLKIAIFTIDFAGSQIIWSVRVGEELAKAGHNVTLIRLQLITVKKPDPPIMDSIEQWFINASVADFEEMDRRRSPYFYKDMSYFDPEVQKLLGAMTKMFVDSCEVILSEHKEFQENLKNAKFDIAFSHMYDFCAMGLIKASNIPTWIWLNGGQLMDNVAEYIGVPSPPSYVPPMMSELTDEMTFSQRIKSLIGRIMTVKIVEWSVTNPQTKLFRKYIDPNFPDLIDVAKSCPLVMVNSNELYNLPRPILHKTVYIGGLGMQIHNARPLTDEFKTIADKAKKIAIMTFGSHANASAMPDKWKMAFINSFRKFPDVEFIIRYTTHDLDSKIPPNVHLSKWIPQTDLLQHEKTKVLITHGGYNSLQEAIYSSTPLIAIPLFGDQPGNAKLAEKHQIGYVLKKTKISEAKVTKALHALLDQPSYMDNVKRLHNMVMKKPIKAEELLIKWTEFVAEFKTLDNLKPYGTELNFIQYHSIDVIATLISALLIIIFVLFKIICFAFRFIRKFFPSFHKPKKINVPLEKKKR